MKKYGWIIGLAVLPMLVSFGCGELGKVDQGRVIKFDKAKGMVTLIRDVKADTQKPEYTHLPPVTYAIPADPSEMGPDPKAGFRMKLDTQKKEVTIYDPVAQNFKTIAYTLVEQKEKVDKEDPALFNNGNPIQFPLINREKKTVTLYSKRQQILTTFTVPDEYLSMPDYTWEAGEEVRIYYKEEGKARRLMNITKTDIFKK
jgi:hypothetical protein